MKMDFDNSLKELIKTSIGVSLSKKQINLSYGIISIEPFDKISLIGAKIAASSDILFYLEPLIIEGNSMLSGKVLCHFQVSEDLIFRKFDRIIQKVKKQHEKYEGRKIFFVDSESNPEFHMGLFQTERSLNIDRIHNICIKNKIKDIICLTRRVFLPGGKSNGMIYFPDDLKNEGRIIRELLESSMSISS
jgi:hypothetical protein